jgi:polyhydroxybutyrate depolymerase
LIRRTRLAALLLVLACSALGGLGCRRKQEKRTVVQSLDHESAVLPRWKRATAQRPAATRESVLITTVSGTQRRYIVVDPLSLVPGRRYPLVLLFHGDGGDATGFHKSWPFERASGDDAILVYAEGVRRTWDLETLQDNADERFVETIIGEVASSRPIDRSRIFAAGYSSGGFLANLLACRKPGMLRGIVSNAGGAPYNQREKWDNGYPKCPGQAGVAMLALHGEGDEIVTLDSGRFSAEYWAYVNGCATDQMETTGYPECRIYRGCPQGKAVGFCSIPSLGHWVWDEAAEASWTFFQRV